MAMSTTDPQPEESVEDDHQEIRSLRKWSIVSVAVLLVILISGGVLASHYQPIVTSWGFGVGHPEGAHQEEETLEIGLRNTGPVGITVVALNGGDHFDGSSSQLRLAPTKVCPLFTPQKGGCPQNRKTGLLVGKQFHPFSLSTDNTRPVLLQYRYPCVSANSAGTLPATLTLPVTYRFLWFTHTLLLTESASDSATCSPN
jgi:hypothetical protein